MQVVFLTGTWYGEIESPLKEEGLVRGMDICHLFPWCLGEAMVKGDASSSNERQ
jgi:hypothetical protein